MRGHGGAQGAIGPQVQRSLQHLDNNGTNCFLPCMQDLATFNSLAELMRGAQLLVWALQDSRVW